MTQDQRNDDPEGTGAATAAGENGPEGDTAPAQGAEPGGESRTAAAVAEAGDETERLRAEVAGLRDQLLRAVAETENLRRRSRRELEDQARYAVGPLARDLLAVADNLRRALDSGAGKDGGEQVSDKERLERLIEGVTMIEKDLLGAFEKHKIQKLEPLGERLDPHRHEAMFEVPSEDQPNGTIIQVVEPGYLLHDRLLRPARVGVAKNAQGSGQGKGPGKADQPGSTVDTSV